MNQYTLGTTGCNSGEVAFQDQKEVPISSAVAPAIERIFERAASEAQAKTFLHLLTQIAFVVAVNERGKTLSNRITNRRVDDGLVSPGLITNFPLLEMPETCKMDDFVEAVKDSIMVQSDDATITTVSINDILEFGICPLIDAAYKAQIASLKKTAKVSVHSV